MRFRFSVAEGLGFVVQMFRLCKVSVSAATPTGD